MVTVFRPEHQALDSIFSQETVYRIPEYQRPYSWQALGKSDANNQINQMWDDLWSFFQENDDDKEYFLGSMVVIETARRKLDVVDGQQRLTSLILLFAAMRCFLERCLEHADALSPDLKTFAARGVEKLKRFIYNEGGLGLTPELKVKIERSAGYDFDAVLNDAAGCKGMESVHKAESEFKEVAERYFRNRDYFVERLDEIFLDGGALTQEKAALFDKFFSFLQIRVAIVTITTSDFDTVQQALQYKKATLEHVIPQQPAPGNGWLTDFSPAFRKEFTYRLGSMTLLTSKMNSAARNNDFARKQSHYKKTQMATTRELSALATISEDFIKTRHDMIVSALKQYLAL